MLHEDATVESMFSTDILMKLLTVNWSTIRAMRARIQGEEKLEGCIEWWLDLW